MIREQLRVWYRQNSSSLSTRINVFVAAVSLLSIVVALAAIWPLENLGYGADTDTHRIVYIDPASAAEEAGLRVGDQILTLYDRTIEEVSASINITGLIGPHSIPMTV